MKIIEPSFEIQNVQSPIDTYKHIEKSGRLCYKSDVADSSEETEAFIERILKRGHESVIEHVSISVLIICDRGVSHEIVRHRLCSFSQESTRYANYAKEKFGKEITVIKPFFWKNDALKYACWKDAMYHAEKAYLLLIKNDAKAQEARSVLPNSLKTEIMVTANIREWRHIFKLRCSKASHPQMREVMIPLLHNMNLYMPVFFSGLAEKYPLEEF
jgi:thymidylate synthase (FAD)